MAIDKCIKNTGRRADRGRLVWEQPWESHAATPSVKWECPRRVLTAGSEMPAVMRHLYLKWIPECQHGQYHLIMGLGRLISCKSILLRDFQSDRLNSALGTFTTGDDCIPILGSLCKVGSWTNRQTREHKMKLVEKGTKKLRTK